MRIDLAILEDVAVTLVNHHAQRDGVMNEALIDTCIVEVASRFECSAADRDKLKLLLTARYKVRMDTGVAVYLPHESWLPQLRQAPGFTGHFWKRYRVHLAKQEKLGEPILKSLDESTERIVDLCGNPNGNAPFQRRGLIIGDVQSGKTANYIGICCKAADAGYRVIVLLTGTLEALRKQTQQRLDEGFVGFYTDQQSMAAGGQRKLLGVGLIDQRAECQVLTTRVADFSTHIASQANIRIEGCPFPTLLVTKKNAQNLGNIIRWLQNSVENGAKLNVPILVIDDESDNASVNTNERDAEATKINKQVRELLVSFDQASYVGVTATPFANVFIRHDSVNEMIGDDLFPKHFIYSLSPPTNYWGVHRLFGDDADADASRGFTLTNNEDAEAWLPLKHKIDASVDGRPASLDAAVRHFVIATAIRDSRDDPARPARAMLVNVSRFTRVQNAVRDAIEKYRKGLLLDLEAYSATNDFSLTETGRGLFAAYQELATANAMLDSPNQLPTWDEIRQRLTDVVRLISTTAVNSDNGAANLDFKGGKRLIVVGGNSLSRGITLEGLGTSYFYRKPLATDTLVQMGRWFGYRDGYVDLCRIYLSDDAQVSFAEASETLAELRIDIEQMNIQGRTPEDFGLRVLHHPGRLAITARKKMRESKEVTAQVTISDTFIETRRVPLMSVAANRELVEQFCTQFAGRSAIEHRRLARQLLVPLHDIRFA
jgi:Z1 domain